jgi:hypothetical protein
MRTIQISTETFSKIWALRREGEESEDDILQRVLPRQGVYGGGTSPSPPSSPPRNVKGEGKMRWVDDIVTALKRLGGEATLDEIYRTTKAIREAQGRSVTQQWQATIRRTLEDHSSDSANYRAENLFRIVGRGTWALR